MAITAGDWTVERDTGAIDYTGDDHTGAAPTYATVIEAHRWLQELADDAYAVVGSSDEVDMTELSPSARSTDNIITMINGYYFTATALEHLYDGSIIMEETQSGFTDTTIYDGIVNFGNKGVLVQLQQNGAVLSDDWWNYNVPAGTHDGGAGAEILTDSGETWTTDEWIGYWIYNTTDTGARGLITDNDGTTITADLQGGSANNWQIGDGYLIAKGVNEDLTQGITHRFMVKVKQYDVAIDEFKLIGTTRGWGRSYAEFKINATGRGNNVLALSDAPDINNTTAEETVGTWSGIANTEGYRNIDVNNDSTDEYYFTEWDKSTYSINQFYERMKWLTRDRSASTQNGINGELFRGITHQLPYDTGTPAFTTNDTVVWGTKIDVTSRTGGDFAVGDAVVEDVATPTWGGRVLAMDSVDNSVIVDIEFGTPATTDAMRDWDDAVQDASITVTTAAQAGAPGGAMVVYAHDTTGDVVWGQVIKGGSPVDNTVLYDVTDLTDSCTLSAAIVERTISTPWCGISTGSALIGGYGFALEYADLTDADKMTALDGVVYTPPNNVTNTVAGLIHDEDYVIVAPWDGSTTDVNGDPAFNKNQFALSTALTTDNVATVVIKVGDETPISVDTPATGWIRVVDDDGFDRRLKYSAWVDNGATADFTIDTTWHTANDTENDFSARQQAAVDNDVYVTYLDQLASGTEITDTTSAYTIGTQYKIVSQGDSDFTTMGSPDNTVGTVFTASDTDAGGTTGVLAEYVTSESYTGVYDAARTLVVLVRDGGGTAKLDTPIKQYIAAWSFTSTNQTNTVIRTTDV